LGAGALFEKIEAVESHPAALAQCERFFAAHPGMVRIESEDTAGSVARIVALGDLKRAAIAGRRAAELYGGSILREDLQDRPENYTRFLLLTTDLSVPAVLNHQESELSDKEHREYTEEVERGR